MDLEAQTPGEVGANFKAGAENQAIEFIFTPVDHHAAFGDPLDALTLGVDQMHIRPVEGVEVLVVKAGSLAELVVPGLEGLGGGRVFDHRIDARPHAFHLAVVGQLDQFGLIAHGFAGDRLATGRQQDAADQVGPAVVDQVDLEFGARDDRGEVGHTLALPAGLEALCPFGVGRTVITHIDRGGRALEDEELLGACAEVRHALHGGGTGADDADPLVLQAGEAAIAIAAGVVVIPAAGVKGVPLETADTGHARQLGPMQRAAGQHHEPRPQHVLAVGGHLPARGIVEPAHVGNHGLEDCRAIEIEMAADSP